jgi:hypothetical protein
MALQALAIRPTQSDLLFRIGCYYASMPKEIPQAIHYYRLFLQYGDGSSAQATAVRDWIREQEKQAAAEQQP